jgi:Zn-dependent M28 family amino/carboxypeptidase
VALWGGEEEGLLGSRAYVRDHFADPATMTLKPAHRTVAAYFNSDNGTGRVRGIWPQNNLAVRPIFEQWIASLRDLGVVAIGPRSVSATDHASFDAVGLPAFQFMVDLVTQLAGQLPGHEVLELPHTSHDRCERTSCAGRNWAKFECFVSRQPARGNSCHAEHQRGERFSLFL